MQSLANKTNSDYYFANGDAGLGINSGQEPWTPAAISTALWFDAADASTITTSGANITQWNDKSGNNRNATQTTDANRMSYAEYQLNSINVASVRGTEGMSVSYTLNTAYSIVLVCQHTLNGRVLNSSTVNALIAPSRNANSVYVNADVVGAGPVPSGTWSITTLTVPGVSASSFWWNSTNYGSGTHSNWGGFIIGCAGGNSGGSENPNGDIAEIIVLNSAASTDNRQIIEGYLAWKWGLVSTLPNDHPYKNAAPVL
jgi:hypothetical protein